jgi:site-specific DNA recombinase
VEETEGRVWAFVRELLTDPERLRAGLQKMIKEERATLHGDPDKEAKAWASKIEQADLKRSGFQDMAAEGLISLDELRSKLAALGEVRRTAERELESLSRRRQKIETLERDASILLDSYAGQLPEDLDALDPEERHNVYKMLRLEVTAYPDRFLKASGVFVKGSDVCSLETKSYFVL